MSTGIGTLCHFFTPFSAEDIIAKVSLSRAWVDVKMEGGGNVESTNQPTMKYLLFVIENSQL